MPIQGLFAGISLEGTALIERVSSNHPWSIASSLILCKVLTQRLHRKIQMKPSMANVFLHLTFYCTLGYEIDPLMLTMTWSRRCFCLCNHPPVARFLRQKLPRSFTMSLKQPNSLTNLVFHSNHMFPRASVPTPRLKPRPLDPLRIHHLENRLQKQQTYLTPVMCIDM